MKIYKTNYSYLIKSLSGFFTDLFSGSWRLRSIALISLLLGYYLASSITSYFYVLLKYRITIVLFLFIFIELIVRLRNGLLATKKILILKVVDNFRIGITYSIVLEAFKLGS